MDLTATVTCLCLCLLMNQIETSKVSERSKRLSYAAAIISIVELWISLAINILRLF